jgi:hypothetical protein
MTESWTQEKDTLHIQFLKEIFPTFRDQPYTKTGVFHDWKAYGLFCDFRICRKCGLVQRTRASRNFFILWEGIKNLGYIDPAKDSQNIVERVKKTLNLGLLL